MENKRKANGAAPVETDDRSSKRRKVSVSRLVAGFDIGAARCLLSYDAANEPLLRFEATRAQSHHHPEFLKRHFV